MTWTRPERRPLPPAAMLLRLLTLALMVTVLGLLATHHSNAGPIGAAGADIATAASSMSADVSEPAGDIAATAAASAADNEWIVTALISCSALGLCTVLGMALLRRALSPGHPARSNTARLAPTPSARTTSAETVSPTRPSLLVLSISRT